MLGNQAILQLSAMRRKDREQKRTKKRQTQQKHDRTSRKPTHFSLNSRHILSLGSFSFFDTSFFRLSTVMFGSTTSLKSPPVVGLICIEICECRPHPWGMGLEEPDPTLSSISLRCLFSRRGRAHGSLGHYVGPLCSPVHHFQSTHTHAHTREKTIARIARWRPGRCDGDLTGLVVIRVGGTARTELRTRVRLPTGDGANVTNRNFLYLQHIWILTLT